MKELLKIQFPGDAELFSLSHQNDVSAFTLLYNKFRNLLLSFAGHYLNNRESILITGKADQ
jgi:hypothetical protein